MKQSPEVSDAFPPVLIALMKGVVWREGNDRQWQQLLTLQARVRDYVQVLGLQLEVDDAEGYALLRQRPVDEAEEAPRLIPRRPLSYPVSLLLVLLRKKLAEADGGGADRRIVLRRDELREMLRHFLRNTNNEARLVDQIDGYISKVEKLGFLRPLHAREGEYEVVRLLKTFVDAEKLEQLLSSYRAHSVALGMQVAP